MSYRSRSSPPRWARRTGGSVFDPSRSRCPSVVKRCRHVSYLLAALCVASACATATGSPNQPPPGLRRSANSIPSLTALRCDLDAILGDPALAHGTWGVLVRSLKTDETLYALNAR